jgi:hypothetical protein
MPAGEDPAIVNDFNTLNTSWHGERAALCRYLLARASVVGTMTSIVRTVQS